MANRPAQVTETEVKRSIKAAREAGLRIGRVDVDHRRGVVSIIPEGATSDASAHPWDAYE